MKQGKITKFDIERIIRAVEHELKVKPLEKPRVVVKDLDTEGDEGHVVDLDKLECTCDDYEYNCGEHQSCKHIHYAVLVRAGLISQ